MTRTWSVLLSAAVALACTATLATSASASSFTRGFADDVYIATYNNSQTPREWARRIYAAGGRVAEVEVDWSSYEPKAPTGNTYPTSPANPVYMNWPFLDTVVETLKAAGVQPLFLVTDAPGWAQANGGRNREIQGDEPNDRALRGFMQALATRYDGSYPSPSGHGRHLPRVRYYQAWAEANLNIKLAPQWTRSNGAWQNSGAVLYRQLLNAFYTGVKAAAPSDKVVFSGLESYGNPPGGPRTPPVTFLENVLCLNASLVKQPCSDPAHFDVMAADPYEQWSPTTSALSPTDASAPDLGRLMKVINAAIKANTVVPDAHKPLWVTEFGYDSNPPNPNGLPVAEQAAWLEDSFYVFWKEGVSTDLWYLIRDQPGKLWNVNYYSGIYLYNGKRKKSYTAYQFPLVVAADGTQAQIWGMAPTSGVVHVQTRVNGQWSTIASYHASAGSVFESLIAAPEKGALFRAVVGPSTSLTWRYNVSASQPDPF